MEGCDILACSMVPQKDVVYECMRCCSGYSYGTVLNICLIMSFNVD
jgi:hypothetical protein